MVDYGLPTERNGLLQQARVELLSWPLDSSEVDLLTRSIDLAVELTHSQIGYVHYVNPDQDSIELCTWSTSTADYCTAQYDRHYPISQAGIWADSARLRVPQVHNDYSSVPAKRGLPAGHAPVLRHLGVPVLQAEAVCLLLGVGNSESPYSQSDVQIAQTIADTTWEVVKRLRQHADVRARLDLLQERQHVVGLTTWEWDPFINRVTWDSSANSVVPGFPPHADSWDPVRSILDGPDSRRLDAVLRGPQDGAIALELTGHSEDGEVQLLLQGYWVDRWQGRDRLLRGTLLDVTLVSAFEQAHEAATHDVLTGLPNRAWLVDELDRRMGSARHRAGDSFAVHFIDFDGFKAVNDTYGHMVGDEVLRACAQRLQSVSRRQESVARFGGDEFVMIQDGPVTPQSARALAERIRSSVAGDVVMPDGRQIPVGMSIGVAICTAADLSVSDLLRQADIALYEAKRDAGGVTVTGWS
ncbi:MAG: GGDEF domain-containing protein [Actinobacteria bacterium]|nr:GGDEF domain-containing protein [Actinomycetota bacterium]MCB8997267.1 GGDEF domain-containing protein [Actinomycetota bacterium]MCB9423577.1 GGDEF domain-containing protein [Actinomycetota bacterium]